MEKEEGRTPSISFPFKKKKKKKRTSLNSFTPSRRNDSTTALAVPDVSTFDRWCDSVTDRAYPPNAPGKREAIVSSVAWKATTCFPIWGATTAHAPEALTSAASASRSPPVVPMTKGTPDAM
jgi:hypothetical protein